MKTIIVLAYLLSSILFILGLKNLSSPKTARRGNQFAMIAMLIAIIASRLPRRAVFGELRFFRPRMNNTDERRYASTIIIFMF